MFGNKYKNQRLADVLEQLHERVEALEAKLAPQPRHLARVILRGLPEQVAVAGAGRMENGDFNLVLESPAFAPVVEGEEIPELRAEVAA